MDADRFDAISRTLTNSGSRRATLRTLLGTLFGGALLDPSTDVLGKGHGKKPRKASRRKHDDHQSGDRKRRTERRKDRDPARDSGRDRTALQDQRPDAVEAPLASESGRAGSDEVTAADHGCTHAGGDCTDGAECCTGRCLNNGTCSCNRTNRCPQPAEPCKKAICNDRNRCVIKNRARGSSCGDDDNSCTKDICDGNGECIHPLKQNGTECGDGRVCREGQCVPSSSCTPNCADKQCGDDGCGNECPPGCSGSASQCNEQGQCVGCLDPGDCPDPGPCKTRRCTGTTCDPETKPNGTSCQRQQGGPGVCNNGVCAECVTASNCTAPQNGSVSCSQGRCIKHCANTFHRICGSGAGVCQECCADNPNHCDSIEGTTCVNGTCQCSGGLTRCGVLGGSPAPECIDLSREPYHCGSCGNRCPSGRCVNGGCAPQETCNLRCDPLHDPDCEPAECPGDKRCVNRKCACPAGWVDCDGDGFCEACGRCGVTTCPADPATNVAGFCCAGGFCSCGGVCCAGPDCWVEPTGHGSEGEPTGERETCTGCSFVDCWGACCTGCIDGQCASSGPIGGGSIRRR